MTNICTLCLARWPLPALADGCAFAHNPNQGSSAVSSEDTQEQAMTCCWVCSDRAQKAGTPFESDQPLQTPGLLEFDLGASFFQFLLGGFCIRFGCAFFDSFGSTVDQVFGFF